MSDADQKQKLVNIWVAGYFVGYEAGIKSVINILKGNENSPFSKETKENLIILADALETQIVEMTKHQLAALSEDEANG